MSVERALKEAIAKQLSAETALDAKIAAHNTQVTQMISQAGARAKMGEAVLRDQVESAMSRLRAYARDVEEQMGQVCPRQSFPYSLKYIYACMPENSSLFFGISLSMRQPLVPVVTHSVDPTCNAARRH